MRPVGVGLVSVGWMGKLHSRAYLSMPVVYPDLGLRPQLVCAADTDPARRLYATDVLGYAHATGDYREVVDDPAVDVVSICAPNALHREVALAAAAAGKPFWIEKPVGRDVADAAAVTEAAGAAGLITSVGFNYRQAPAVAHIRRLVADGELGRVTSVRCVFLNGQAADPRVALSWRFRREHAGSGVLGDLLSHVADLVRFVLDDPITEVSAASAIVHRQRPVGDAQTHFAVVDEPVRLGEVDNDDYAAVLARFAGGAIGTLEVSRVVVGPRCGLVLEVYGTRGSASWDFERMNELRMTRLGADGYTTVLGHAGLGEYARFQPGPGNAMSYDDLKVIEAAHFLDAARGDGSLEPASRATVADALAAARVVEAAVSASTDGRWARVVKGAGTAASADDRWARGAEGARR